MIIIKYQALQNKYSKTQGHVFVFEGLIDFNFDPNNNNFAFFNLFKACTNNISARFEAEIEFFNFSCSTIVQNGSYLQVFCS